jgi:hypothetical protein
LKKLEKKLKNLSPLTAVIEIANRSLWQWQHLRDDELIVDIPGHWGEYRFHLCWQAEPALFYLASFLDLKVPEPVPASVYELLVLINQRLWMGHFDLVENQWIVFRYALFLKIDKWEEVVSQVEELMEMIVEECETFYPVFGSLLTHGLPPQEALQMGLLDTVGEA